MHRKLGRDTAGTTDPNRPKRHFIPHDIMISSIKLGKEEGGVEGGGVCGLWRWGGDAQSDDTRIPK